MGAFKQLPQAVIGELKKLATVPDASSTTSKTLMIGPSASRVKRISKRSVEHQAGEKLHLCYHSAIQPPASLNANLLYVIMRSQSKKPLHLSCNHVLDSSGLHWQKRRVTKHERLLCQRLTDARSNSLKPIALNILAKGA